MQTRKTAISLFTGAGGMDVGFQQAGFEVVWANEMMPHAASTYSKNHAEGIMHCGKLEDFLSVLPPTGSVDCVFGGPPCQGFSVAGKMDPNDERSKLVFEFMDVVKRMEPTVFVMENVKALATLSKFAQVREELFRRATTYGYSSTFHILNAKDFGVPQSRERVFFIGFKRTSGIAFDHLYLDKLRAEPPSLRSIFERLGPAGTSMNPLTCKARITLAERPIMRKSPFAGMMFNGLGRPINSDGVSCTLPASMGGNKTPIVDEDHVFNGVPSWINWYHKRLLDGQLPLGMNDAPASLRRLTIREAAEIQTFPPTYEFSGPVSSQYTQIGNAVPCRLAYAVASAILEAFKTRTRSSIRDGQLELAIS